MQLWPASTLWGDKEHSRAQTARIYKKKKGKYIIGFQKNIRKNQKAMISRKKIKLLSIRVEVVAPGLT